MATDVKNITVIGQNWLNENTNDKADQSLLSRLQGYVGQTGGVYRLLQTMQKTLRLGTMTSEGMGSPVSPTVKTLDGNLGIAANALIFPRIPQATTAAVQTVSELEVEDGVPFRRKMAKAIRDVCDAVAALGFGALFIKFNPSVLKVAQTADLATDAMDLHISKEDYDKATELEQVAAGDVKEALLHTKNYNWWRVAKAATGVAATTLALLGLVFSIYLLPVIALAILGLAGTIFAVIRDNYKDMGRFNIIKFDREVQLV